MGREKSKFPREVAQEHNNLNLAIIEAVQHNPQLYKNQHQVSTEQRQQIWQQIAKDLNLREQFIKIRWHLLRKRFQLQNSSEKPHDDSTFKYGAEMAFLLPFIRASATPPMDDNVANVFKPEFIITEKDLAGDDSENEEYVFLEVEALEGSMEEEQEVEEQTAREQPTQDDEEENEIEVTTNSETQKEQELIEQLTEERPELEEKKLIKMEKPHDNAKPAQVVQEPQEPENPIEIKAPLKISSPRSLNNIQPNETPKLDNETVKTVEGLISVKTVGAVNPTVLQCRSALPKPVAAPVAVKADSPPPSVVCEAATTTTREPITQGESHRRGEDDIFGELVAAMLKPMESERKRAIKRDIMNLLLT